MFHSQRLGSEVMFHSQRLGSEVMFHYQRLGSEVMFHSQLLGSEDMFQFLELKCWSSFSDDSQKIFFNLNLKVAIEIDFQSHNSR